MGQFYRWRRREHLPAAAPHPRVAAAIGSEPAPPTEGSVGDAWSSEEEECEEGPFVCPGCHAVAEPCAPGCPDAARERELEAREYELDELDDDD